MAKTPRKTQTARAGLGPDGTVKVAAEPEDRHKFAGSKNEHFQLDVLRSTVEALWIPGSISEEGREKRINAAIAAFEGPADRSRRHVGCADDRHA